MLRLGSKTANTKLLDSHGSMRRHAIGLIALVLLLCGLTLWLRPANDPLAQDLVGACVHIGLVLVVVWFSYEQVLRVPKRFWWFAAPAILVVAVQPRMFVTLPRVAFYALRLPLYAVPVLVYLLPVLVLLYLLTMAGKPAQEPAIIPPPILA